MVLGNFISDFFTAPVLCKLRARDKLAPEHNFADFMNFLTTGVFSYLSDRDPNLLKTLDNYDGTVEFLKNLELDDEALTKAIFAAIKETDPSTLR